MAQNCPNLSTVWSSSSGAQNSLCHGFGHNFNTESSSVALDMDMDRLAWQQLERVNSVQCFSTEVQTQRPDVLQGSVDSRYEQELEFQSAGDYIDASSDLLNGLPEVSIFDEFRNRPEVAPESLPEGAGSRSSDHRVEAPRKIRTGRRRRTDNASPDGWVASKNLISERKRREKLQKGLITLREMVPMFTMKMDKVSILTDAINHLQNLKRQLHELEGDCNDEYGGMFDVNHVKLAKTSSTSDSFGTSEAGENQKNSSGDGSFSSELFDDSVVHCDYNETSPSSRDRDLHLTQLDVIKLDHGVFKLDLICVEQSGVLVQLSQAIEAFVIEIVHTSTVFISAAYITCTFIVKMSSWNDMTLEGVRADVRKLLGKSGLQFS